MLLLRSEIRKIRSFCSRSYNDTISATILADISGVNAIYIVATYTNIRKSIDKLYFLVQEQFL